MLACDKAKNSPPQNSIKIGLQMFSFENACSQPVCLVKYEFELVKQLNFFSETISYLRDY